jgi:hypothetical protein
MHVARHGLYGQKIQRRTVEEANADRYPPIASAIIVIMLSCVLWTVILTPVFWLLS